MDLLAALPNAVATMVNKPGRLDLSLWRFHLGDEPEAWQRGYDDSSWQVVRVPHDWAVSRPFEESNSSGVGYLPSGIGWYRAWFQADEILSGERVFLHFDGIYKNAQVWINGNYLGRRPYGYIGFEYDVTGFIRFGEDNQIAVKVSHPDAADSRWYTGSGITRAAYVIVRPKIYVPWDGLFFRTEFVPNGVDIAVDCEVINTGIRRGSISFAFDNRAFGQSKYYIKANSKVKITIHEHIDTPRLWSPDDPQLYWLTVSDGTSINVGIRNPRFDPATGYSLNGETMKIKGVCLHHDAGCLGAAVPPEVWRRRLTKLKAMGCNAVRTSHNPASPELYDLCDEMGFMVMDEAFDEWEMPKNKWTHGHNVYPPSHYGYYEDFPEWGVRDLADMIKRDRNHPSVIMWSIGNEVDYPNDPYVHPLFKEYLEAEGNNDANKPPQEREYNPDRPNAKRLPEIASKLVDVIRELDTTRPIVFASALPELATRIGMFDKLDMLAYNYKEQLYDEDHKRYPNLPIIGSENSHRAEAWQAVAERDFVCGQFLWTGIDYLGEAKGWPIHGSMAGALTTAGFEKDRYYERQAMWADATRDRSEQPGVGESDRSGISAFQSESSAAKWIEASVWDGDSIPDDDITTLRQIELRLAEDTLVEVSVTGGCLAGIDSGDLSDNRPFYEPRRRSYNKRMIVYVRPDGKGSSVTFSAEGLLPVVIAVS